ncbi:acyl-CoA dehydrogenase family protein [Zavarzinia compransoris]|uniref:acyl-CoA dehydrogenase family protein n=1 Tax=Zavarzinia marina TaxID=2911065 RepID=UPI001F1809E3|nr:acyl-CoA dehydrogenase family protein [Zavarzinia marina]MCF4164417.1 acyl-CoA dehydrogenase family protein [Zavarzinia marina]
MQLTEQHEELRRTIRRFVEAEVNPHCDEWEAAEIFPAKEVFRKMGALGLLGINKPEAFGGLGLDYSYAAVAAEEFARIHSGGISMAIGVQTDMATPALARFGSDDLRAEFLAPSIAGEKVACIGVSEPHAGSDVAQIRTRAVADGDDYVINGSKMWITNGTQADWMCMLANTSDGHKHQNKSLICVPLKDENGQRAKGVTVARKLKKMGMHASDTAELFFDDVRVPKRNLIGEPGMGFVYQMLQFQEERLYAAVSSLGGLDLTIQETIDYTRERKAFGKSILDNQVVHFRIIELMTEVEALRALTWNAVQTHVEGEDCTVLASMAKLKAARLSREVNDACLQFWGGMGYMDETMVSRRFRDGRLTSIGGGADEVMIGIIAKFKGLLPGRG